MAEENRQDKKKIQRINFGKQLKAIREEKGYSLNALARSIEVDPAYLFRIESGEIPASAGIIKAIADELEYSRYDLLSAAGHITDQGMNKLDREVFKRVVDSKKADIQRCDVSAGLRGRPKLRYMDIEEKTSSILCHYEEDFGYIDYPSIPIEKIAWNKCGFRVQTNDGLGPNVLGTLDTREKIITLNTNARRIMEAHRFTIAHEIGHWFLMIYDDVVFPSKGQKSAREREADMFAASILMPSKVIGLMAKNLPLNDPIARYALSRSFKVSQKAMEIRLCELGLVSRSKIEQDQKKIPVWKREKSLSAAGIIGEISFKEMNPNQNGIFLIGYHQ